MSDQVNLIDIVIRMRAEGKADGEIATRLAQMGAHATDVNHAFDELAAVSKKAEDSQTSLADAMAKVREQSEAGAQKRRAQIQDATEAAIADAAQADGLEKLSQETKKVEDAQRGLAPEIEKGITAKKQYREALKGLALEFPILARVMALLANPLTGVIAVLGTVIALVKQYADSVREAGIAAQEMEKMATTAYALAAAHAELAKETADFEKSFAKIATDAETATTKLGEYNRMLLLKQQLEEKLADAELVAQIDKINKDPKLSDAQKIDEISKAQSAARVRTRDRDEATAQATAEATAMVAHKEAERARMLKAQAAGMDPQIGTANKAAEAAANEAAGFPESQKKEREELTRTLEMVRRLMEAGKGGTTAVAGTLAMHPFDAKLLADKYPPGPGRNLETIEQEILAEQRGMKDQADAVAQRSKDKAQAAQDLVDEKARLKAEATAAEKSNVEKANAAREQFDALDIRRAYRRRTEPVIEGNEANKSRDQRNKVNQSAEDEGLQMEDDWEQYKRDVLRSRIEGKPDPRPPRFTTPTASASSFNGEGIVSAIDGNTEGLAAMGSDILAALERQNRVIESHRAAIQRHDNYRSFV